MVRVLNTSANIVDIRLYRELSLVKVNNENDGAVYFVGHHEAAAGTLAGTTLGTP